MTFDPDLDQENADYRLREQVTGEPRGVLLARSPWRPAGGGQLRHRVVLRFLQKSYQPFAVHYEIVDPKDEDNTFFNEGDYFHDDELHLAVARFYVRAGRS